MAATLGTTGRRGIFLWDLDEWITVLASYNRSLDWAGATAGLTRRLGMAVVSSTTPWHQSARVGATVHSPWVQTLRIDSGDPLERIHERLHQGDLEAVQPTSRLVAHLGRDPEHPGMGHRQLPAGRTWSIRSLDVISSPLPASVCMPIGGPNRAEGPHRRVHQVAA